MTDSARNGTITMQPASAGAGSSRLDSLREQTRILEMVATGAPHGETLDALMRFIEAQEPGARAGLLIVAEDGRHFRRGSGPSLPEACHAALDGMPIAPPWRGSCGEAAHRCAAIVVPDIAGDDRYSAEWRALMAACGLAAVRSTPVVGTARTVLGSLAIYYDRARDPTPADPGLIETATHIAAVAIEREAAGRAEARLAAIVESADDAIIGKDLSGIMLTWNAGAERIFGYTPEEAVGRPVTMLMPPDRVVEEGDILDRIRRGERIRHFETVRRRKDGSLIDVSLTISPIVDGHGRIVGASKIARDITERKRTEASLHASEARYRGLFDSIDEGFCVIEMLFNDAGQPFDYRFLEVNAVFEQQTGLIDPRGRTARELAPELEQHWYDIYGGVAVTGAPTRFRNRADALGRVLDVYAFRTDDPALRRVAILFRDVTAPARAEANAVFLDGVSHDLLHLTSVESAMSALTERVARHFEAALCAFSVVDDTAGTLTTPYAWHRPGVTSVLGDHRMADYVTDDFVRRGRAGETYVIRDTMADERANPAGMETVGVGALVSVPVVRGGTWQFSLSITDTAPRDWRADEIVLMRELTTRIWTQIERARTEAALRESEERLRRIIDGAREYAIIALDVEGRITMWNNGAERLLGHAEEEVLSQSAAIFFTPEDRARGEDQREMQLARRDGRAENERWHIRKDGTRFWGSGVMLPIKGGGREGYLKIFRDGTEARAAERHRKLLTRELSHRIKNTLATVQALASQTMRSHNVDREVTRIFQQRLQALAAGHDLLTQEQWAGAPLDRLVATALAPFRVTGDDARMRAEGPAIQIAAKPALAMTMALHEMATNAIKYGALSNAEGRVDISWSVGPARDGSVPCLNLCWIESGGPPVERPRRTGFGTRLLRRSFESELGAETQIEFAPEGLRCALVAPLAALCSRPPDSHDA